MQNPVSLETYNRHLKSYEEYAKDDSTEWLKYKDCFSHGKQGLVGTIAIKKKSKFKYAFKLSQYMNYLVQHEYAVMKSLNDLRHYCPHFCKVYDMQIYKMDGTIRKKGNPFISNGKHTVEKEVLFMELIKDAPKFCQYLQDPDIQENEIYSTIKQVLMAVSIAQRKKRFTHYDLHSDNILMRRCDPNIVFLYALDKDNQFLIPTNGHYPIVIDFGFSYIGDMDGGYLWPSMGYTDVGFLSDRYDWVADPKLFLVSVSQELKFMRPSSKTTRFRNIVKNIFAPLKIKWECGWDDRDKHSIMEKLSNLLDDCDIRSKIFHEYENYCLDLIQSLIILPIENRCYDSLQQAYTCFVNEYIKIEKHISSDYYNLYILKGIVDAARDVQADYHHADTRQQAIINFQREVYSIIDQVASFCQPTNVKFEKMLCSLLVLAKNIEGVYAHFMNKKMVKKNKEYSKLSMRNTEQIYGCIEANIPDKYKYTSDTKIIVLDALKEKTYTITLDQDQIKSLNDIHPLSRGMWLYSSIQSNPAKS